MRMEIVRVPYLLTLIPVRKKKNEHAIYNIQQNNKQTWEGENSQAKGRSNDEDLENLGPKGEYTLCPAG